MIDPRTQYIIYKEQESELVFQIERKLGAEEGRVHLVSLEPWYVTASHWLKEKLSPHRTAITPCPDEVPC